MKITTHCIGLITAFLAGCATPIPFEVIDSSNKVHHGFFGATNQYMEISIGDEVYQGFYIVSTTVESTTSWPSGFGRFPRDSVTVATNNNARAHLTSAGNRRLVCEFLFQRDRAIGECKSPQGKAFQLVVDKASRQ